MKIVNRQDEIRSDLDRLRERGVLACPDWFPDYAARKLTEDEEAGKGLWPGGKTKK